MMDLLSRYVFYLYYVAQWSVIIEMTGLNFTLS